jgi:transposase
VSTYASYEIPSLRRPFHWPRSVRLTLESIIAVFVNAYQIARGRAVGNASSTVRLLAQRDDALWRAAIAERRLELFRRRLHNANPLNRPDFVPDDRLEILKTMWYRGWSIAETAEYFVLHRNTVSEWLKRYRIRKDLRGFLGRAPFNKVGDATRWLVHEMRRLGIRFGTGTRTIAAMIVEAGVKLSRTTVQRILREQKPRRPCRPRSADNSSRPTPLHILHPKTISRTWHLDLTALHVHGMRFHIAALMDGFSRRLVALKVYARTPTTRMMAMLVKRATVAARAAPRFVITDHGTQFRRIFENALVSFANTTVVRCRVHDFRLNGKVERFFRTMKEWARLTLFAWFADRHAVARSIQKRLDAFAHWFNSQSQCPLSLCA